MKAEALTPRDIFAAPACYEIPPFQRPYVWTEEDQWQPLWDDVKRVTEAVLEPSVDGASSHFLGAVVIKQLASDPWDPARHSVIDGQQRLTTLQLLLDAAQLVIEESGEPHLAESMSELVVNKSDRFRGNPKRFKLWPSRGDRQAFEAVMNNDIGIAADVSDSRVAQAHAFFHRSITEWAMEDVGASPVESRLRALARVLQQHLQIVVIALAGNDDDQLIFETLNDRGTPLLQADLIKNYVFQRCEDLGADVDDWAERYWADFDEDWWREQVAQGRLYRSRIDLFLQYWLTMRVKDEIPTDAVFGRFRKHASEKLEDRTGAEAFLTGLRDDADTFRAFAQLDPSSARGTFYTRVVEALELGAFIPLLLWLISEHHPSSPAQADKALNAVESWAVRRTLLRRTMKDVNKLVVALLRDLDQHASAVVGDAAVAFLASQTADARTWPTDDELVQELPQVKAYGNIKQQRLRTIFSAIELRLRSERHESVTLPTRLEVEHVMPQGWRSHWDDGVAADLKAAAHRDRLVSSLGNLTLVTQKLNGTLSHRPWTDAAATEVAPTGKDAGLGKRTLLSRYSLLVLNKEIVDAHIDAWSEADISERNGAIAQMVASIWSRPSA